MPGPRLSVCAALIAVALVSPARAAPPACTAPAEFDHFNRALPRLAEKLALGEPVKIVAIGSSSTAGAGASTSAASYPSRLEATLREKFPGVSVTVLNRGVNGEEVRDMLARLDRAVIAEKPDLVIWQLGSNSVLRDHDASTYPPLIADGIKRMKAAGADVLLMDPQFAPKMIERPGLNPMLRLMSLIAKDSSVELFHRFEVMRHWRRDDNIPFTTFLAPDQLHMNDWGYDCVAKLLAGAIANAATRVPQTAAARR